MKVLANRYLLLAVYLLAAAGASWVQYHKGKPGEPYTRYNNYVIFREAFTNLRTGTDLYAPHPDAYNDLYKYSPSFAVFFAPFRQLDDLPGLMVWNLVNTLPIFFLVWLMPHVPRDKKPWVLWLVLLELITSLQNAQSNGLVTALALGTFIAFERKNVAVAALLVVFSAYIKIFGIVTGLLFLLYDKRLRFMAWTVCWAVVLAILPVIFTPFGMLVHQYESWWHLLQTDQAVSDGISVYGLVFPWTGGAPGKGIMVVAGIMLLLLPTLFFQHYYNSRFRLFYFASILLWVVIFNHRAESPTYVIAVAGLALWFAASDPGRRDNRILLAAAVVLTVLSPTDLFPRAWREQWVVPYSLKALPCVLVWLKITASLIGKKAFDVPR